MREHGLGLVLPSLRGVPAGVAELLSRQAEFRAAVGRVHNRAAAEVVGLLARWLPAQVLAPVLPSPSGLGAEAAAVLAAK